MEFNVEKSIAAQKKLCEGKGAPHFAPDDGKCWHCRQNIYSKQTRRTLGETGFKEYTTGVSVETAGRIPITGCPHCNRSFCD